MHLDLAEGSEVGDYSYSPHSEVAGAFAGSGQKPVLGSLGLPVF